MNARAKLLVMQLAEVWREITGIKEVLLAHGEMDHEMNELAEVDQ